MTMIKALAINKLTDCNLDFNFMVWQIFISKKGKHPDDFTHQGV